MSRAEKMPTALTLSPTSSPFRSGFALCVGLALSACGGSSGGGNDIERYLTDEYARTPGLSEIRAAEAYALTPAGREGGQGQSIGVIDDGIDGSHEDIERALARGGQFDMLPSEAGDRSHGTSVAGIAAAARNDRGTMGVAFNAALVDYDAGTNDNLIDGLAAINSMIQAADAGTPRQGRADVLNMSWGSRDMTPVYNDFMGYAASRGVVMVVSTGNESASSPSNPASMVTDPQIAGMGIAVAAGTRSGLASYSNACGAAAQYCLVGPGTTPSSAPGTRGGTR
ncbi:S8 family serine peptidase, partial [Pelagibius sp.]|uniref:S8 family serine peptidase n=1 Tax=Pelagibius sp. TaxID=1931238 RepID=UPI0026198914